MVRRLRIPGQARVVAESSSTAAGSGLDCGDGAKSVDGVEPRDAINEEPCVPPKVERRDSYWNASTRNQTFNRRFRGPVRGDSRCVPGASERVSTAGCLNRWSDQRLPGVLWGNRFRY